MFYADAPHFIQTGLDLCDQASFYVNGPRFMWMGFLLSGWASVYVDRPRFTWMGLGLWRRLSVYIDGPLMKGLLSDWLLAFVKFPEVMVVDEEIKPQQIYDWPQLVGVPFGNKKDVREKNSLLRWKQN